MKFFVQIQFFSSVHHFFLRDGGEDGPRIKKPTHLYPLNLKPKKNPTRPWAGPWVTRDLWAPGSALLPIMLYRSSCRSSIHIFMQIHFCKSSFTFTATPFEFKLDFSNFVFRSNGCTIRQRICTNVHQ